MTPPIDLLPRLSEKTYALSNERVYVVQIKGSTSKQAIKKAMEERFSVEVLRVRTAVIKGKSKRTISRKGRRVASGRNSDLKKAYVTLKEGHTLPFFEAVEEEEKKAEKVQSELAKQQEKEDKKKALPKRIGLKPKKKAEQKG